MDRRKFLTVTGAAGVAAVWGSTIGCAKGTSVAAMSAGSTPSGKFSINSVGLQLYTVRTILEKDPVGGIQQVAAAGYHLVETAGLYGKTAAEIRALFDANGIRTPSGHYGIDELEKSPDTVFATAHTLGQEFVTLNWLAPNLRTQEFYAGFPARLNKIGAAAKAAGLKFAYHNHDFEFETFGGSTAVLDRLLAGTDPSLVNFEMDAYWVYKAGSDPRAYVEKYPGRFAMIHIKDSTPAPAKAMADVGKGVIDFGSLLASARTRGLRYAFVERDDTQDPIATIRTSHEFLTTLLASR